MIDVDSLVDVAAGDAQRLMGISFDWLALGDNNTGLRQVPGVDGNLRGRKATKKSPAQGEGRGQMEYWSTRY